MKAKNITVNMHKAKSTLSRLIDAAEKGHHVTIARNGKPAVELVAVNRTTGRKAGTYSEMRVLPGFFEPLEEMHEWEKNL